MLGCYDFSIPLLCFRANLRMGRAAAQLEDTFTCTEMPLRSHIHKHMYTHELEIRQTATNSEGTKRVACRQEVFGSDTTNAFFSEPLRAFVSGTYARGSATLVDRRIKWDQAVLLSCHRWAL